MIVLIRTLSVSAAMLALMWAGAGCSGSDGGGYVGSEPGAGAMDLSMKSGSLEAGSMTAVSSVPEGRDIVRNGQISVRVADLGEGEAKARRSVADLKGYVGASSSSGLDSATPIVDLTVRVPVARFDEAMAAFAALGTRLDSSESTEDVTVTLADQQARLKTMLAQEEAYREMLRSARSVKDTLEVQDRLMRLRADIEALGAQRRALADQAALSTVRLTLTTAYQAPARVEDKEWADDAWTAATASYQSTLRSIGRRGIWLLAFWPLWVPMLLVGVGFLWVVSRMAKRGSAPSRPSGPDAGTPPGAAGAPPMPTAQGPTASAP